jgi:hypothetical protein
MKVSELVVGDIVEIDKTGGRAVSWTVREETEKRRLDELPKGFDKERCEIAWKSTPSSILSIKYMTNMLKKTKLPLERETVPAAEFRFNLLEPVFPYSFKRVVCTSSPAVYLGTTVLPYVSFGVKKHHTMLIDGKVCLYRGSDVRLLRKVCVE